MATDKPFSERVKDHWLPVVVGACITAVGITWAVAQSVAVAPRDFQIAQLERDNARLEESLKEAQANARSAPAPEDPVALAETGVSVDTSVTTKDGRLSILVTSVIGNSVRLSTTLDASRAIEHDLLSVGDRVKVDAPDKTYYIDVRRARSNIVDLAVSQLPK